MTYSQIISERILGLCWERNITINKLATLSGMNQSTLDNIMRENTKIPKVRTIHRLAQGLGMTLTEFFDFPEINEALLDDE